MLRMGGACHSDFSTLWVLSRNSSVVPLSAGTSHFPYKYPTASALGLVLLCAGTLFCMFLLCALLSLVPKRHPTHMHTHVHTGMGFKNFTLRHCPYCVRS